MDVCAYIWLDSTGSNAQCKGRNENSVRKKNTQTTDRRSQQQFFKRYTKLVMNYRDCSKI